MIRSTLAISVLLPFLLAGCDSGQVEEPAPSPIVGAWLLTGLDQNAYVVPAQTVTSPDLAAPGTGSLSVDVGGEVIGLPYVVDVRSPSISTSQFVVVQSYPAGEAPPSDRVWARVSANRGTFGLSYLTVGQPDGRVSEYDTGARASFELMPTGLRLDPLYFRTTDPTTGQTFERVAQGSLTFTTRSFPAGVEIDVAPLHPIVFDPEHEQRLVFEADGTYRDEVAPEAIFMGRWEVTGNRLRLYGEGVGAEFECRVEGDTLVLTPDPEPCVEGCLRAYEAIYYLDHGALTSGRTETSLLYARSGGRARP